MADYILSCCSTADLSAQHFQKRGIHYICFHFMLDGTMYLDDLGQTVSYEDFYARLEAGSVARTSQVNADEFIEYFTPFLKDGKDILHVCLSSGLSGVYNSACIARDELSERFPERHIFVVDSLGASSGYGLLMDRLADLRDEGMSVEDAYTWVLEHRLNLHHWFFSTDLSFYVKGGRISRAEGLVGTVLKICPVLNMDASGKLVPQVKTRGKKKAVSEVLAQMEAHAEGGTAYSGKCFLCHSALPEDAKMLASAVEEHFPSLRGPVEIFSVGTTIGSHTGPGTVALFFWGDERT